MLPWPYDAASRFEAAHEYLIRQRADALDLAVHNAGIYNPDNCPRPFIRFMCELLGMTGVWTDLLGETHERAVMRHAHYLNRLRGTRACLDRFANLSQIGYFYQIHRDAAGIPDNIDFWVSNPPGVTLDADQINYVADAYERLLPRRLMVNKPISLGTEIPAAFTLWMIGIPFSWQNLEAAK